ncbi:hypothetical protein [Naasia aerilata]|uniref:hypothetical protein n=1 Tax=Naasia aerilata TaxID=1162966 RepID=UPI0025746666|nr:hypothetical protein [Naasia aerilata]
MHGAARDDRHPFFRHSANYTGRQVVAMPPVYPADKVARAIVALADAPKDEVVVGGVGKAMVKQHRVSPGTVEAQMAVQVEKTHLSRHTPAEDTTAAIYEPFEDASDPEVGGGWEGGKRTNRRKAAGVAGVVGAAALAFAAIRGRTSKG